MAHEAVLEPRAETRDAAPTEPVETFVYLPRDAVRALCAAIDPVAVMREVFTLHASGDVVLPDEAYLPWSSGTEALRSLNMPAFIGGTFNAAGTKIINSNCHNVSRGIPRASGLTLLFEVTTGRVQYVMEGASLSALRTAAVSMLAIETLAAPPPRTLAVLGCGAIGRAHADLAVRTLDQLERIVLYDTSADAAAAALRHLQSLRGRGPAIEAAATAESAVVGADVIVATTTVTSGYVPMRWLRPGAVFVNVSLDDLMPAVFLEADLVVVDDWNLVQADGRRTLGKMYRSRLVKGPRAGAAEPGRRIDAELGEVITGRHRGRRNDSDVVVVNPFGLAIEDVALARRIANIAAARGLGLTLPV